MNNKRITIYDLAKALDISVSYVSKALNDHPTISTKMKELVKKKAEELNYRHNSHAANLRKGSSKTLGVIVPHIDKRFFSEAIAGIEEVCFENGHSLIICQSHDSFEKECLAVDTLIRQNVDGILISVAAGTRSSAHLKNIMRHGIALIQFDRHIEDLDAYKVLNDNEQVSSEAVKSLIEQGYERIAYIGGPVHLMIFEARKKGYLKSLNEAKLEVRPDLIFDDETLSSSNAKKIAIKLLMQTDPPDAFFTVSDDQALGVLQAAEALDLKVPEEAGIFGFANEAFTAMIKPSLSSIDQKSKEMGKRAADLYLQILNGYPSVPSELAHPADQIVKAEILKRDTSLRHR